MIESFLPLAKLASKFLCHGACLLALMVPFLLPCAQFTILQPATSGVAVSDGHLLELDTSREPGAAAVSAISVGSLTQRAGKLLKSIGDPGSLGVGRILSTSPVGRDVAEDFEPPVNKSILKV